MMQSEAEVVREVVPVADGGRMHGVTIDHALVWFARDGELVAFDPARDEVVRRLPVGAADAGTAFDGEHLYQLAKGTILVLDPRDGRVVRTMPAPGKGDDTGMAWADGHLWIGQGRGARIHKVDAKTGEVVRTLTSDRFVTGVSVIDGALWHGTMKDGEPCELRRLGEDGTVEEAMRVPVPRVAGIEGTRDGGFWCAGENGRLRLVRRKR
ncbi:YncE family protein [Sandaracinus amylolyticus]|uniref:WD40-like repeat protein n=1 Tax=Sandaracinus amylolyticus TaxID=927083 RepID=A0A0F6VYX9_9BACT|nr:PQQ-binding-like beta-propeller repeat protein [Sandaracinus amylolyticus]AKF03002.1 WD40-like repeat protein [Sandaracinus amylolyticus]